MNMAPPNDPMLSGYRNGPNNNNRNGNHDQMPPAPSTPMRTSDQAGMGPADILDLIQLCLQHFQGDELQRNEFLQGLADLLDGNINAQTEDNIYGRLSQRGGTDQLPNLGPLAASGGNHIARMTQSSNRGTFSRREQDVCGKKRPSTATSDVPPQRSRPPQAPSPGQRDGERQTPATGNGVSEPISRGGLYPN